MKQVNLVASRLIAEELSKVAIQGLLEELTPLLQDLNAPAVKFSGVVYPMAVMSLGGIKPVSKTLMFSQAQSVPFLYHNQFKPIHAKYLELKSDHTRLLVFLNLFVKKHGVPTCLYELISNKITCSDGVLEEADKAWDALQHDMKAKVEEYLVLRNIFNVGI